VQRKALHAGTAGTGERWRLALGAKARADTPDLLAGPFPKGDALLHGGRHGTGELGCVIDQRIISRGHGGVDARFQVPELPQFADDTPADFLDHVGDVGVRRWLTCDKVWRAPLVGAIKTVRMCTIQGNNAVRIRQAKRQTKWYAPLRSARDTASQPSGRQTGQRGCAELPPPHAGLPGIYFS